LDSRLKEHSQQLLDQTKHLKFLSKDILLLST
jgi:hypothetical protein